MPTGTASRTCCRHGPARPAGWPRTTASSSTPSCGGPKPASPGAPAQRFGNWNSVWKRFDRWARKGTWRLLFEALQDPDLEWLILDSTVIRAHPCAAGPKKSDGAGGQDEQALGRSRGGFRTKVHVAVNGLGLPVKLVLTPGQAADVTQAETLIRDVPFEVVIADRGYDSQAVVEAVETGGGEAVIPSPKNRKVQRAYDRERYKDRNLVERFWAKIKHYRRVATRYERNSSGWSENGWGFFRVCRWKETSPAASTVFATSC